MANFRVTLYKSARADWYIEADTEAEAIGKAFDRYDEPDSDERNDGWEFGDIEQLED